MVISGEASDVGTSVPTLLYQDEQPTCDPAVNFCQETVTVPITIYQRFRYVYISTTTCLQSFFIESFASKSILNLKAAFRDKILSRICRISFFSFFVKKCMYCTQNITMHLSFNHRKLSIVVRPISAVGIIIILYKIPT